MKPTLIAALLAAGALTASCSHELTRGDLLGEPGVSGSMTRTIRVTPATRHINVLSHETVNLDVNGQTTTWKFDGLKPVPTLSEIIPGAPGIYIYVTPSCRFAPCSAP